MERRAQLVSEANDILKGIEALQIPAFDAFSPAQGRPFVPKRALHAYLTNHKLKVLLKSCGRPSRSAENIRSHYLAVFSILLEIGKGKYVQHLLPYDAFSDDSLPFHEDIKEKWPTDCRKFFCKFYDAQWKFCAQHLKTGRLENKRMEAKRILPFTAKTSLKKGPNSDVFKVKLHPNYNDLVSKDPQGRPSTDFFVLKSYRPQHDEVHRNEVYAYELLQHRDITNNIVRFHGSWKHGETYNILLEYVSGGTLEDLLEGSNPSSMVEMLALWTRLYRVLEPVARIHCHIDPEEATRIVKGVHQDIRPSNILVSSLKQSSLHFDRDFKLIDLGLTYFQVGNVQGEEMQTRDARGSQTYSAPECFRDEADWFDQRTPRLAHPKNDVWSLGCLFSEVAVWCVLGPASVIAYRQKRKEATERINSMKCTAYSGCFHDGTKVLTVVFDMHRKIREALPERAQKFGELLVVIESMLRGFQSRADSFTVLKQLRHIYGDYPSPSAMIGAKRQADQSDVTDIRRDKRMRVGLGSPLGSPLVEVGSSTPKTLGKYTSSLCSGVTESTTRKTTEGLESQRSYRTPTRPIATVGEVRRWITEKKYRMKTTAPVCPSKLEALRGRDQIFIIDSSESMKQHWADVRRTFGTLAYLVKGMDPDGIDLYFTNSSRRGHARNRGQALTRFDAIGSSERKDATETFQVLLDALDECGEDRKTPSFLRHRKKPNTSIYVLTDGRWTKDGSFPGKVSKLIEKVTSKFSAASNLGIQFIQFGNDNKGLSRLEDLDDAFRAQGQASIIDTEPCDGNVYKMLLGSFDRSYDKGVTPDQVSRPEHATTISRAPGVSLPAGYQPTVAQEITPPELSKSLQSASIADLECRLQNLRAAELSTSDSTSPTDASTIEPQPASTRNIPAFRTVAHPLSCVPAVFERSAIMKRWISALSYPWP